MINASNVAKYFGGKRALGPVSLEVEKGEIAAFLGLNGVGKTTFLRIVAGDLRPSAGSLTVGGVDAIREPLRARRSVGFLPERPPVYPDMTVVSFLRFAGELRGLGGEKLTRRIEEVVELVHLDAVRKELVRNLSYGYRQRVGVGQAIIHEPELLILDEPTHDLDPVQIVEMRSLISKLRSHHTILISSHNLPEISQTCDRIYVLNAGEIIASGTEADLSAKLENSSHFELTVLPASQEGSVGGAEAAITDRIAKVPGVRGVTFRGMDGAAYTFEVEAQGDIRAEVSRALFEGGHSIIRLEQARHKLENLFLHLIKGGSA
jgi:ABC-2 type transport system ATP-binding protein